MTVGNVRFVSRMILAEVWRTKDSCQRVVPCTASSLSLALSSAASVF